MYSRLTVALMISNRNNNNVNNNNNNKNNKILYEYSVTYIIFALMKLECKVDAGHTSRNLTAQHQQ